MWEIVLVLAEDLDFLIIVEVADSTITMGLNVVGIEHLRQTTSKLTISLVSRSPTSLIMMLIVPTRCPLLIEGHLLIVDSTTMGPVLTKF